jgi:PilZ domain-containing protein
MTRDSNAAGSADGHGAAFQAIFLQQSFSALEGRFMTTGVERRRAPRYQAFLPVRAPTAESGELLGVTRDVSSGGLFLYTEMECWQAGSRIEFVLQFPQEISDHAATTRCRGTVVRAEGPERARGIAVRIDRISFLDE